MLGCQSDRTTFPNHVEELFKLYYNIVRTYAKTLYIAHDNFEELHALSRASFGALRNAIP